MDDHGAGGAPRGDPRRDGRDLERLAADVHHRRDEDEGESRDRHRGQAPERGLARLAGQGAPPRPPPPPPLGPPPKNTKNRRYTPRKKDALSSSRVKSSRSMRPLPSSRSSPPTHSTVPASPMKRIRFSRWRAAHVRNMTASRSGYARTRLAVSSTSYCRWSNRPVQA